MINGNYKEYSRTTSGWTIYTDPSAPLARRWWITHPLYGELFFAEHDEILKFTVKHMAEQFKKTMRR